MRPSVRFKHGTAPTRSADDDTVGRFAPNKDGTPATRARELPQRLVVSRKLKDRLRLLAVAASTQMVQRLAILTLWLERVAEGSRIHLVQRVTLALGRKGIHACNFLSKCCCTLLARYMRGLGEKELARQIAQLSDQSIDAKGNLGIYFEFQYRVACLKGICDAAGYCGENAQIHGRPPVVVGNDVIGVRHSATASASPRPERLPLGGRPQ